MRYYSDELKKFYDTEEALLAAEETARKQAEETKITKAKLAKNIEEAKAAVDDAYIQFDEAKAKVEELQKEYDAKVNEIMDPVRSNLQKCVAAKRDAIQEFNKNYGAYTTVYKGNDAINEWIKTAKSIDKIFNRLWW